MSVGFYRQECWSGLLCPPPGDLPSPGIEPMSFKSSTLAGRFFTTSVIGEAQREHRQKENFISAFNSSSYQTPVKSSWSKHSAEMFLWEKGNVLFCLFVCLFQRLNLKVENYTLLGGLSEDLSLRGSLSGSSEGLIQRGKWGARLYRDFCNKDQVVGMSINYH